MIHSTKLVFNSKFPMNFNPNYMDILWFERFESHEEWRKWINKNSYYGALIAILYLCCTMTGIKLMKRRPPFKLRQHMLVYDMTMALFCALGAVRMFPELVFPNTRPFGLVRTICFLEYPNSATAIWGLLFVFLKTAQLGDTVFLILRKVPIRCSHFYLRASVNFYCWFAYGANDPASRWFCAINYFVTAFVYLLCAVKVVRYYPVIQLVRKSVASLQSLETAIGLSININTLMEFASMSSCTRPMSTVGVGIVLYTTYVMLNANYFFYSYFLKKRKRVKDGD